MNFLNQFFYYALSPYCAKGDYCEDLFNYAVMKTFVLNGKILILFNPQSYLVTIHFLLKYNDRNSQYYNSISNHP